MDLGSVISAVPTLLQMMPLLLKLTQILFFLFFIWFFGSLSMRGFRARKPLSLGLGLTLISGALCLFSSSAFSGFLPFLSEGIYRFLGLDMLAAGLISAAVMAFSLNLMTHDQGKRDPREMVERLKRKVANLEDMLRSRGHHISESEAKKAAEEKMPGFKAVSAKVVGNEFEVTLRKGKKEAKVILDAWDGEVKKKIQSESALVRSFRDLYKVSGLAILVAFMVASAVFFEGLYDPMGEMESALGIDMGDVGELASVIGDSPLITDTPEGCASMLVFTQYYEQFQDRDFVLDHVFEDEQISRLVEENCGTPLMMVKVDHEGSELVIAVTDNNRVGYVTDGNFCMCVETLSR
jgi:hypothetical protein